MCYVYFYYDYLLKKEKDKTYIKKNCNIMSQLNWIIIIYIYFFFYLKGGLRIDCAVFGSSESHISGEPIMYNWSMNQNLSMSISL